ncbi:MAG: class B sortase [Anaerostipes sp.]|nr:class B sortase [Anaerostipes sp.]
MKKKSAWKVILVLAILIFAGCLGKLGWDKYQDYRLDQEQKATLKAIKSSVFVGETDGEEPQLPKGIKHGSEIDFKKLTNINSDVYAWIYIPGTKVDYPIAQSSTDDTHYLKYNYKNEPQFAGCIYTEKRNSKSFTDPNTVIYGHNMRNNSMFGGLDLFKDEAYFNKNRNVYIYTEKKIYTYQIFAAYTTNDSHILKSNDFSKQDVFQTYLTNILRKRSMEANINKKMVVSSKDKIITLSTCVGGAPNNRYLVQAVLKDERNT